MCNALFIVSVKNWLKSWNKQRRCAKHATVRMDWLLGVLCVTPSTYLLGDIAAEATHVEAAAVARALVHLWCARLQHNEGEVVVR